MAARNKPYDQFGPYILFKKLEGDSLGELWRAGRLDGSQLGPTFALRRFTGHREAFAESVNAAAGILPKLTGASFVRDQVAGVEAGMPFVAWDYAGGRSLRYIIDRGRGSKDVPPNPLPIDQAMIIAEKVALSLATTADLRDTNGTRLSHGALVPHFIWISDDGEIRVGGQLLGTGVMASLADPKVAADIGRYFSPEQRAGQRGNDVYSMGAILFLLITGQEPPDAATASAFMAAVRAAKTQLGAPIPDDIRVVLDKSFNLDASMRYASMTDMKQAISALAHGGKYSATTFNLAFYLSNLLKKEMESETVERDKESKLNVAPYLEVPKPVAAPITAAPLPSSPAPAMFGGVTDDAPKAKSKLPLAIAAVAALALVGGGAYMMMNKPATKVPAAATTSSAAVISPPATRVISEPIAVTGASTGTAPATATTGAADPAAQQKAFEEAVRQKMNAEMMKLQEQYMAELRRKSASNAPAPSVAPTQIAAAPAAEDRSGITASQLDQQRRDASRQEQVAETPAQPVPQPAIAQPQPAIANTQTTAPAVASVPQRAAVREGDIIDVSALDVLPRPVRAMSVQYPPLARAQKVTAMVIVSAFINEDGHVTDVKVLRGESRFGINDAAVRAMRAARFSSPMKDGKRVKTWLPQTFDFKP
jgi:TonB family protein